MSTRTPKRRRTLADIDAARKCYNPETEGYGNPGRWRRIFYERIGFEEAQRILRNKDRTAWDILGVTVNTTWQEVTAAFRRKAMQCHPDRVSVTGMSVEAATEAFKELNAAYSVLAHQYGK